MLRTRRAAFRAMTTAVITTAVITTALTSSVAFADDEGAQPAGHRHDHVPHFSDINWFHGLIGEKEGERPSLLWRAPGTPVPFGALLLNTAILFFLIGRFGGPGIKQGLIDRRERITGEIENAAAMRREAEVQLEYYEERLAHMEAEMRRIREEMRAQALVDRARVLAEARHRQETLKAEATQLIEQELSQTRHDATLRAVARAVAAARDQVLQGLTAQDHERLTKEFRASLESEMKSSAEVRA